MNSSYHISQDEFFDRQLEKISEQSTNIDPLSVTTLTKATTDRDASINPTAKPAKKKRDGPSSLRKAPGAPKRFKSSYILFFMEKQKEIKAELGEKASVSTRNSLISITLRAFSSYAIYIILGDRCFQIDTLIIHC